MRRKRLIAVGSAVVVAVALIIGSRIVPFGSILTTISPSIFGAGSAPTSYQLSVSKLELKVPIVMDVDGRNEKVYDQALEHGVAQMAGTAHPGDPSNMVLFGHSSAPKGYRGEYGSVFARLGELNPGDKLTIRGPGFHQDYTVRGKKVVKADETGLIQATSRQRLTLSTCWPIGNNTSRLIVWADPSKD